MKHHKFLIPVLGLPVSMHLCAQTSIGSDGWEQAQFELGCDSSTTSGCGQWASSAAGG